MFEADALCQRVAVINLGRIIALDSPAGLKKLVSDLSVVELEVFGVQASVVEAIRALPFVESASVEDREQKQILLVHSSIGSEAVPELMASLDGLRVGKIAIREPTLEDAYVRLVGSSS
jgi:ABC-2 type transport system ATP-binding protein